MLRNLNQDALEKNFGAVRVHGYANIMPHSSSIDAAYKTLLLNNLSSKHSVGANCEINNGFCFDSLKYFLTEKDEDIDNEGINVVDCEHINLELADTTYLINNTDKNNIEKCAAIGYCNGWMALKAKNKIYKNCQNCHTAMETKYTECFHGFIKGKVYDNKYLMYYPSRMLFEFVAQVERLTYTILGKLATKNNISKCIKLIISINIETNFITCMYV